MAIEIKPNIPSIHINSLQPLEKLTPLGQAESTYTNSSLLAEFGAVLAQVSEPAIRSKKLQQDYMEGKPINIDEIKIAQMKASLASDLTIKLAGKFVHFIESTTSMQI